MSTPVGPEDLPQTFRLLAERERQVWEAIRTRDMDALAALSSADYASINEDGLLEWPAVVEHLRRGSLVAYDLGDMTLRALTPEVVAIAFKATVTMTKASETHTAQAAILSIWVLRNGRWLSTLAHEVLISAKAQ